MRPRPFRVGLLSTSLALVLVAGACGASASAAPETKLSITLYPNGIGQPGVVHRRLSCHPPSGTVAHPANACRVLLGLAEPFAAVPAGTMCTDIDTGPQVAKVVGHVRGKVVRTELNLRGGCQIDRWRALASVVPGFSGAGSTVGSVPGP
ncbi:MAG TPA: hypothetical protein VHW26_04485 [Solirubrobacteraceae bacterium]|nr:hypothetical protein [Solirubrobacteraceae bacterium]